MKWLQTAWIACVVALGACHEVTSTDPVGSVVVPLEIAEWEGVWSTDGESCSFFIAVEDPEEGRLMVAAPTEGGKRTAWPAFVRAEDGEHFLSVEVSEENELLPNYFWLRVRNLGDVMLLWAPDVSEFTRLVDEGVLPGESVDGNLRLGTLSPRNMAFIASDEAGVLFHWKEPAVLRRIGGRSNDERIERR